MVKNLPANAGDPGLIPGLRRSPEEGNGYSLQYSCLGNPMDRGAWRAIVHGISKESDTTEHADMHTQFLAYIVGSDHLPQDILTRRNILL